MMTMIMCNNYYKVGWIHHAMAVVINTTNFTLKDACQRANLFKNKKVQLVCNLHQLVGMVFMKIG